jgi:hypothetical protein
MAFETQTTTLSSASCERRVRLIALRDGTDTSDGHQSAVALFAASPAAAALCCYGHTWASVLCAAPAYVMDTSKTTSCTTLFGDLRGARLSLTEVGGSVFCTAGHEGKCSGGR